MRALLPLGVFVFASAGYCDIVVAAKTIRPNQIIMETDVSIVDGLMPNGFHAAREVVGQEAQVALYMGRPILVGDIGPPALIRRNQIVGLRYHKNGISIGTDGRALERGAVGDRIRVMNLGSRTTLTGEVLRDGTIDVKD